MSNPTHKGCPSDIAQLTTTDYRPKHSLYTDVYDNNKFRKFLQHNANAIRNEQLKKFESNMRCCECEIQPKQIEPFDKSKTCNNNNNSWW